MQLAVGRTAAQVTFSNGNAWDLDTCQLSKLLFNVLVHQVRGKALVIVRPSGKHNGADAWRLLKEEFEPALGSRHSALLIGLLNPQWSADHQTFAGQFRQWEIGCSQYELSFGGGYSREPPSAPY